MRSLFDFYRFGDCDVEVLRGAIALKTKSNSVLLEADRAHDAFLKSNSPEDEGLYDDDY